MQESCSLITPMPNDCIKIIILMVAGVKPEWRHVFRGKVLKGNSDFKSVDRLFEGFVQLSEDTMMQFLCPLAHVQIPNWY